MVISQQHAQGGDTRCGNSLRQTTSGTQPSHQRATMEFLNLGFHAPCSRAQKPVVQADSEVVRPDLGKVVIIGLPV